MKVFEIRPVIFAVTLLHASGCPIDCRTTRRSTASVIMRTRRKWVVCTTIRIFFRASRDNAVIFPVIPSQSRPTAVTTIPARFTTGEQIQSAYFGHHISTGVNANAITNCLSRSESLDGKQKLISCAQSFSL